MERWWCLCLVVLAVCDLVTTQSCRGGILTFEKVSNYRSIGRQGEKYNPESKSWALDCIEQCRDRTNCVAFQVDYGAMDCKSFIQGTSSPENNNLLTPDSTFNYFEKICLDKVNISYFKTMCAAKMWAFERVPDAKLEIPGIIRKVTNRNECARQCFIELNFTCRAANYESSSGTCTLLREDRRTYPSAYQLDKSGWEYIENQCSIRLIDSCVYSQLDNIELAKPDHITNAPTRANCTAQCDEINTFFCRSYAYHPTYHRCALSSGDKASDRTTKPATLEGVISGERECILRQCAGNSISYEKSGGYYIEGAVEVRLEIGPKFSSVACLRACTDSGTSCPAVHVDYTSERCYKLDRNTQGSTIELTPRNGSAYFEQMCMSGSFRHCQDKTWSFGRIPGHEMVPQDHDIIRPSVQNRRDCEALCLAAGKSCLSATYDSQAIQCRLSDKSRRTHPKLFREVAFNRDKIDYLENECSASSSSCRYIHIADYLPRQTDVTKFPVHSLEECESTCKNFANFTCRSAGFRPSSSECRLSSEDSTTNRRVRHNGATLLQLQCSKSTIPVHSTDTLHDCYERNYERTTGVWLPGGAVMLETNLQGGIVSECRSICDANSTCVAFSVDSATGRCYMTSRDDVSTSGTMLQSRSDMSYFEAFCVPKGRNCQQLWAFKRMIDKELRGFDREIFLEISKTECLRRCMTEKRFVCRSVSYTSKVCRLSDYDHVIVPMALLNTGGSEYLHNECLQLRHQNSLRRRETSRDIVVAPLSKASECKFVKRMEGRGIVTSDKAVDVTSERDCQKLCLDERFFNCRSYTYFNQGRGKGTCSLNSETQSSMGVNMQTIENAVYVEVSCSSTTPPTNGVTTSPNGGGGGGNGGGSNGGSSKTGCDEGYTFERIMGRMPKNLPTPNTKDAVPTTESPTTTCLKDCLDAGDECKGVALHYSGGAPYASPCSTYNKALGPDPRRIVTRADTAYFEKICLRAKKCSNIWTFERIPGYVLLGFESKRIQDVRSREACMDKCLEAKLCRSAQYFPRARMCHLSAETRRSQPFAFRFQGGDVQYMENQCRMDPSSCNYVDLANSFLPYADKVFADIASLADCRQECGNTTDFKCRSVSYDAKTKDCSVSACDRSCIPTVRRILIQKMGSTYSERSSCTPPGGGRPMQPRPPPMMPYPPPPPLPPPPPPLPPPYPPRPYPPRPYPIPRYPVNRMESVEPRRKTGVWPELQAESCTETYIKVTGMIPKVIEGSRRSLNISEASALECIRKCSSLGTACSAFILHQPECTALDDANVKLKRKNGVSFFRKICLKGPLCSKLWAFDYQPGFQLKGLDNRRVLNVDSLDECAQLCLAESGFPCRSAEFALESRSCRLSSENRHSKPGLFQVASRKDIHYIENQCRPEIV